MASSREYLSNSQSSPRRRKVVLGETGKKCVVQTVNSFAEKNTCLGRIFNKSILVGSNSVLKRRKDVLNG